MKIVHVELSGPFNEEMNYQEKNLAHYNALDGHDITLIVSDFRWDENGNIQTVEETDKILENGVRLIRLRHDYIVNDGISRKVRKCSKLYPILENLNPDVIFHHNVSAYSLLTVTQYKKAHTKVKLYADNHADFNNTARTFFSKNILHRIFYKPITGYAYRFIDQLFYISHEAKEFLAKHYNLSEDKLEFYPLGGTIIKDAEREEKRNRKRAELGLADTDILLCHSGKLDELKRTADVLDALCAVKDERLKLIIIGSIPDNMKDELMSKIERDSRVKYLGWKNGGELLEYLCASDLYCQPGSQSATMQNAICCGVPVMLYPHKSHPPYVQGNGWFVKTVEDMKHVFQEVANKPEILQEMSRNSYNIAYELLDYKKLAARLYE